MARFLISCVSSTHRYRTRVEIVKGGNDSAETFTVYLWLKSLLS